MPEHLHPIETTLYERFKLRWLEGHGYTLYDLMSGIDRASADPSMPIARRLEEWERDAGFKGEVWPCLEEFLETEFRDGPLMRGLCHDESEYAAYLAAYPTRLADSGRAYAVLDANGALTLFRSFDMYREGANATTRDLLGTEREGRVWEVPEAGGEPGWREAPWVICSVRSADGQAIRPTDCQGWFRNCKTLESADLSGLDTSRVTSMYGMFDGCDSLEALDLSSLDTSQVTDMSWMFDGCEALASLDLTNLDTSRVTDMTRMFAKCESLRSLDLSGWDTSHVTDMSRMFAYCGSLEAIDLSPWDTSRVTGMYGMFESCESLESLDPSGWDTSRVKDMCGMFDECVSLRSLDVSGWNTSRVTNMCGMFEWCESLDTLDLSGWDVSRVTDASYMFYGSRFSEPPALPEGSSLEAEWNAELNRRERDER